MKDKSKILIKYTLISLISMIIGSLLMFFIKDNGNNLVRSDKKFELLDQTYNTIKKEYYKDIDDEKLVEGAINGMLGALDDPHTMYFTKEEKEEFDTELSGTYYGIGAEIANTSDGKVIIKKVFDKSPAKKAGLKANDIFVSIDGEKTDGKNVSEVAKNLRSNSKETTTVIVNRDGKELSFKITKENVTLYSVSSDMLENDIGYIAVSIFGQNTYSEFMDAINDLESKNLKSLIIDLRGNNGGYLTTVSDMLSLFLDSDKVIYQMQTKEGTKKYYSTKSGSKNYKVIILVDGESASASEIMASAMKEQYNSILVGTKTYGKGTVQITKDLSNGGMIKYTIQNWLTPNGNSIEKVGITPDYEIELSKEYINNPSIETDNQLQKAIELLK